MCLNATAYDPVLLLQAIGAASYRDRPRARWLQQAPTQRAEPGLRAATPVRGERGNVRQGSVESDAHYRLR